jgi:predicted ATPase
VTTPSAAPRRCLCSEKHDARLVVLTGGPGAGKTAVLEVLRRRDLCEHVALLPESASIVFSGGFPRRDGDVARRSAQRAIFHVQRELERLAIDEGRIALALCDRGTLDGAVYWPGSVDSFFEELGTTRKAELSRYAAVIHLRSPSLARGYNHQNPVRIESPEEAATIDARLEALWSEHPRRTIIDSTDDFLAKLRRALVAIQRELPACCGSRDLISPEAALSL